MQRTGRLWIGCVLAFQALSVSGADFRGYGGFRPLSAEEVRLIDSRSASGLALGPTGSANGGGPQRAAQPYGVPGYRSPPLVGGYRFRDRKSADAHALPKSQPRPFAGALPYAYPGGFRAEGLQGGRVFSQPLFRPLDGKPSRRELARRRPFSQRMLPSPAYPYTLPTPDR